MENNGCPSQAQKPIAVRVFVRLRLLHRLVDDVTSSRSLGLCEVKRWWTPAVKTEEGKPPGPNGHQEYFLDSYDRLVPAPVHFPLLFSSRNNSPADISMTTTTTTSIEDDDDLD
ncbi:unnamed protein product [Heligmosomoides polygyrus]|uniref:Uncharacterized protein n=1 Tax=Heligmosomoides polygyrus TaxID=6339 RepID=A0A183GLM5_HELPZ|nr:unnamed protein product [Heligmosomoides polygyrus]